MRIRLVAAALGAAVAVLAVSSPASAGTADCIYQALPKAKRDQVDAVYDRSRREGARAVIYTADEALSAAAACIKDPTEAKVMDAMVALAGHEFQMQAVRWFVRQPGVTPERIENAWKAVDPQLLRDSRATMRTSNDADAQARLAPAREPFLRALGIPVDSDSLAYAALYLYGRVALEVYDTP